VTGADRRDAPGDLNFDDLTVMREEAQDSYDTAVDGSMPPDETVPETAIEDMRVWLACGATEVR
jgi:hypothetical protein